jgi:hypothetical protein
MRRRWGLSAKRSATPTPISWQCPRRPSHQPRMAKPTKLHVLRPYVLVSPLSILGIVKSTTTPSVNGLPSCPDHTKVCLVLVMDLMGIMLRNRCWPIIFHTITAEDVDRWCQIWLVWSTPHSYPTDESKCGSSYDFIRHLGLPLIISVSHFGSSRNHQIGDHALDERSPSILPSQMKVQYTLSSTT